MYELLGLIVAVAGVVIAWLAYRHQKEQAHEQKNERKTTFDLKKLEKDHERFKEDLVSLINFIKPMIEKELELSKSDIERNIGELVTLNTRLRDSFLSVVDTDALTTDQKLSIMEDTQGIVNSTNLHMVMLMILGGMEKSAEGKIENSEVDVEMIKEGMKDMPVYNLITTYITDVVELSKKVDKHVANLKKT